MNKDLFGMGRAAGGREDTKGRKGPGTSPFGPAGLTTVPIPCVSRLSGEGVGAQNGPGVGPGACG